MDRIFRVDFYPHDWLIDTAKLTPEQRGIFIQVVCLIYAGRGPIANDAAWISGQCGCSARKARGIIEQLVAIGFLYIDGERLGQKRADSELEKKKSHLQNSSKGGRISRETSVKHSRNSVKQPRISRETEPEYQEVMDLASSGTREPLPTPYPSPYTKKEILSSDEYNTPKSKKAPEGKKPDGYPPEFEAFWQAYPKNDGSKRKASEKFSQALAEGVTADALLAAATAYALYIQRSGTFLAHAATWLHQGRWEIDYANLPNERNESHETKRSTKRERLFTSTHAAFNNITSNVGAADPFGVRKGGAGGSPENAGGLLRCDAPVRQGAGGNQGDNAGVLQRIGSVPDAKDS